LPDAADREVRPGFDAIVCRHAQRVPGILARQHGEQGAGFGAFAHDHGVGQLRAEQQSSDAGVPGNGPHDVGHPRAAPLARRHRRDRGLSGGGQLGDDPVEDSADEFVLVREAFVEITRRQARPAADPADGQLRDVPLVGPQQVQAGFQQPPAARGQPLGGLDAPVWPLTETHEHHLDTSGIIRQLF